MRFNRHPHLEGLHAPFSPSQSAWLRYDDDKMRHAYIKKKSAMMGTRLHAWAKETIDLEIKQPNSKKTLYSYVNDAIGYRMKTEVVLYYSDYFFGTADTISFRDNYLRIHDLKTGENPVSMEQLKIYAAIFCLEYKVDPFKIEIELRIYQNDKIRGERPEAAEIKAIMDDIIHKNKILEKIDKEED